MRELAPTTVAILLIWRTSGDAPLFRAFRRFQLIQLESIQLYTFLHIAVKSFDKCILNRGKCLPCLRQAWTNRSSTGMRGNLVFAWFSNSSVTNAEMASILPFNKTIAVTFNVTLPRKYLHIMQYGFDIAFTFLH